MLHDYMNCWDKECGVCNGNKEEVKTKIKVLVNMIPLKESSMVTCRTDELEMSQFMSYNADPGWVIKSFTIGCYI
jgi:hypothetical protein